MALRAAMDEVCHSNPEYAPAMTADKGQVQRATISSLNHVQNLSSGAFSRVDLVTVPVAAARKLCVRKTLLLAALPQLAAVAGAADLPAVLVAASSHVQLHPAVTKASSLQDFAREVAMLRACEGCPFLLQLLAAKRGQDSAILLLEYASHGSLFDTLQDVLKRAVPLPALSQGLEQPPLQPELLLSIRQNSVQAGAMPEAHVRFYIACVLEALTWLHQRGIIHRDVKPDNLLLFSNGYLKLADMGCCCQLPPCGLQLPCTRTGTNAYMAPEVKSKEPYSYAVDIWSLGMTAWQLLAGELPACAEGTEPSSQLAFPAHFSLEAQDMLSLLLSHDPAKRPSIAAICSNSWFTDFSWEQLRNQTMSAPLLVASSARQ